MVLTWTPRLVSVILAVLLLATTACRSSAPTPPVPATQPSVLLITIDTLRADRLGVGLTPTLDALARESVVFSRARSAVPLTLPSHATILSGLLPPHHGLRENGLYRFDRSRPTMASVLKARGYRTGAVVGAFVLDRQFGLDAGFDVYDDRIPRDPNATTSRLEAERPARVVTDAALAVLDTHLIAAPTAAGLSPSASPFFLWVHYYDPHSPYEPPPEYLARARGNPYNGEIAYVDAEITRLFDGLGQRRVFDQLVIVVAGDHGESLGEHGERTHGMLLYESAVRVPLIIRAPGRLKPAVRPDPASLADVAPTVLALVGGPAPTSDGSNLARTVSGDRELYAETNYPRAAGWSPLQSLVAGQWKLIHSTSPELYDLDRDPNETRSMATERSALAAAMDARVRELATTASAARPVPTNEVRERLRALGYVAASPTVTEQAGTNPAREVAAWGEFEDALSDITAGRAALALPRLKMLATRYPAAQVFSTTYAQAQMAAGRPSEALVTYRASVARWPGDAVLLHDLAVAAQAARQPAEALRAERAALVVDPNYPTAHNGVGLLLADGGRAADAAAAFEKAATLEPSNPSFWTNLGNARRELRDQTGATAAYQRALAVDPAWPDAANGMGVTLVQAGRAVEAVGWFEKALTRAPDFYEARLNLGIACQQAGQIEPARRAYRAVLAAPARYRQQRDAAARLLEMVK
ncbi:MAG TPA: sulfatase-like hydrolase/transferase [Vicinamibacterales bacterium]